MFWRKLHHPHLVKLYGVVTKQRPVCIVTEFVENGCLLHYIRQHDHLLDHTTTLIDICHQVSCFDFVIIVASSVWLYLGCLELVQQPIYWLGPSNWRLIVCRLSWISRVTIIKLNAHIISSFLYYSHQE